MTIQPIPFVLLLLLTFLLELRRGVTISGCIANERDALLNFKKSLKDKNNRLASWNGEDCCKWEGVSCNNLTGHVVKLDLRNPYPFSDQELILYNEWSLRGQLSSSLLSLKQLNYLDLSMNYFDGPIPKFLGSLHYLGYLNLSLAGFYGLIPHRLGNLSRLEYLDLNNGYSDYGSEIDDSHWISCLTSLKHLTLKNTIFKSFQNSMEALNKLPNIAELCISSCDISDFPFSLPYVNFTNLSYLDLSANDIRIIPLWLFDIKSLTHLDLRFNRFSSSIPDALESLTSLQYIDLSDNNFSGALPHALKNLTSLRYIDLSDNNFSGALPQALKNLTSLQYIDFSSNHFSGALPQALKNLTSLQHIDFSSNHFSGALPQALKNLTSLQYIDFSFNNFSGVLPQAFENLCKLHTLRLSGAFTRRGMHEFREMFSRCHKASIENLDLSWNNFNGRLPNSFGELHNLKTLDLSYNLLFGSIPESLGHLVALEKLLLSSNSLNGTIPKSIGQLSNLVLLHLGENSLEGVMSEVHFTGLAKLKELNLQSNNLILNVSHDWIPPFKLSVMDMGSCKIGPHFPQWLETQVNLSFLNLSSSDIVDILPNWFWDVFATQDISGELFLDLSNNGITGNLTPLSELDFYHFDVSNNSFFGSIQPTLGNRRLSDSYLDLSRNKFSGEIPLSLCLAGVQWIDLSWNLLTGELPNCWNRLAYTYSPLHFDFSRNNLYGNIPHSLGTLTNLGSLHLSHNNLSGSLPMTLRNCVQLTILDLSMNNLTGIIPTWVGEGLADLKVLVLRSNNFMGNVPSNLSKLKQLRILDLANNTLTGRIPRSFGNFRHMMDMHPDNGDRLSGFLHGPVGNALFEYYEYVQLTIKKGDWNYDKLLTQITIIDLSFNNLSEQIPKELGNLHGLICLNLSGNHLVGSIPDAIGLMRSLESLDLSRNELSGNIPSTMSNMTALNSLNLSYNNLFGKIPSGNQLQTFTNDSYIGNPKLCGFPLTRSCSNKTSIVEVSVDEVIESDYWYVSIALGFVLGGWIVWGTFLVKKNWKKAFFQYVDYVYDAIYVVTTVNINRFKRKIGNETALD